MTLARRFFGGTGILTASNAVVRLLSLVSMPLLTRWISPAAYGEAALVGTTIALVSMFAIFGLDVTYQRAYLAQNTPNGWPVEHYVWRLALMSATLSSLITGAVWALVLANIFKVEAWYGVVP